MLIDTHCHLDDPQFDDDRLAVLDRAKKSGIGKMVNIGYSPERWDTTIALTAHAPEVMHSLGLHPHHADEWSSDLRTELKRRIGESRAIAVGETGLDYFRNRSGRDRQQQAFAGQIDLASELGLPIVVHLRGDVEADTMTMLDQAPPVPVILHSFEGSQALAEFSVARGYYFGIGGLATRQKDLRLQMLIQRLPADRLLLETDSPYLAPKSWRSRRNEPAAVAVVASFLADLLGKSQEAIQESTTANALRCFSGLAHTSHSIPVGGTVV